MAEVAHVDRYVPPFVIRPVWLCDVLSKTAHGSRQPLYLAGVRGFLSWFEEGQRVMLTTYLHTCVRYICTLQCGRYRAVVFRKLTAVSLVAQPENFDT
jgi:hypothetical protein